MLLTSKICDTIAYFIIAKPWVQFKPFWITNRFSFPHTLLGNAYELFRWNRLSRTLISTGNLFTSMFSPNTRFFIRTLKLKKVLRCFKLFRFECSFLKPLNVLTMFLIFLLSKISYFIKLRNNCYENGSKCKVIVEISHQ